MTGAAETARVVHLVPPNGGGVDRFVRDLVAHRPADWIVHVCETQAVVEVPARGAFFPLAAGAFADLARAGALGVPRALHAHGTTAVVRDAAAVLHAATAAPVVLTLHDIGFDDAAAGDAERALRLRFAAGAAVRTAPSGYIAARADAALGRAGTCRRVENGADPLPVEPPCGEAKAERFDVAVIGAIGEHKGLAALLETVTHLPPDVRVVIFGYTAQKLMPGWTVQGRLWMHGAFEPAELPALVASHGVRVAWFPPGMPESHCYALSDAWLAGLPVLAPDHGALAERVRRLGGGTLYDPRLAPPALARAITEILAIASCRPPTALTSVQEMVATMNGIYRDAGDGSRERPADEARLRELAQTHLDTRFFRKELLRLQGELAAALQARDRAIAERQAASQRAAELEREIAALQARLDADVARLSAERDAAVARHARLAGRLARPLRVLPAPLRDWVLRLAKRVLP